MTNPLWIDTEIIVDEKELQVRGSTDPAIVNTDAEPLFVTEIKTTTSLDHLSEPKPHHRAHSCTRICMPLTGSTTTQSQTA